MRVRERKRRHRNKMRARGAAVEDEGLEWNRRVVAQMSNEMQA